MNRIPDELYAVCSMSDIPVGGASPFDLVEIDSEGSSRPLRIVILRPTPTKYQCYVNTCPHQGVWLNIGSGSFLDESGKSLRCSKHGALFDIESGACTEGPCVGASLRAIPATTYQGDICISGVRLVTEDEPSYVDPGEMMEITITPE